MSFLRRPGVPLVVFRNRLLVLELWVVEETGRAHLGFQCRGQLEGQKSPSRRTSQASDVLNATLPGFTRLSRHVRCFALVSSLSRFRHGTDDRCATTFNKQPATPFCKVASGSACTCSIRSQDRCATPEALQRTQQCSLTGNCSSRDHAGRDAHSFAHAAPLTMLCYSLMLSHVRAELRAASLQAAPAAANGPQAAEPRDDPETGSAAEDVTAVADTLIREFRSRKPAAWRKLIGYSKRWSHLAEPVFDRSASVGSSVTSMCPIVRSGNVPQHIMTATYCANIKREHPCRPRS